ncbi:protein trichome birefringence-like 2 isoform X2 [Papaver somniferum]|nr:protein trichome birefringence-like 2 isoform X2 [Papaver somniferum]
MGRTYEETFSEESKNSSHLSSSNENCDIYKGKWVRDENVEPYYPVGSCPHIDKGFDCHANGRPNEDYLRWRWQPDDCNLPSLNATDFLERLRGKRIVFVGDSQNRNMWKSLVCMLRHGVANTSRVHKIPGKNYFMGFIYEDYNCSLQYVSAPFLVSETSIKLENGTTATETLRLDLMHKKSWAFRDADVIVFNTGQWWNYEKTSKGENYYQEGTFVYPKLKVLKAFEKALNTWGKWVDQNIDTNRTQVIFKGYSFTHFKSGQWNTGGQCHKETEPNFSEIFLRKYPTKMKIVENVLRRMKTPVIYMNISKLTDYRKDGHPSIYRTEYKTEEERVAALHSQDCSHWCLPGVPDVWNQLMYASLLKSGQGPWTKRVY